MIYQSKKLLGFLFLFFVLTTIYSFSQNKRKPKSKEYYQVSLTDFNFLGEQ